jgi:hypothetical protein
MACCRKLGRLLMVEMYEKIIYIYIYIYGNAMVYERYVGQLINGIMCVKLR